MTRPHAPAPIIVYGAPRSGTTYLRAVLAAHPEVCITDEAWVFMWVHHSLATLQKRIEDERRHRPQDDGSRGLRFRGSEDLGALVRTAYPEVVRAFYRAQRRHARYWGDKNPHYVGDEEPGCLETIRELFPDARFVHLVRDGRDVALSMMRQGWLSFDAGLQRWRHDVDRGSRFGRRLPLDQYVELRYEDLVADDVGMARGLFASLAIPMHPAVERFCHGQREQRTPLSTPTRDLGGGVERSVWAEVLTPLQRQQSVEIAGEQLVRYGYETQAPLAEPERRLAPEATARLIQAIREIVRATVPTGAWVLVVSEGDEELLRFEGREGSPFPQTESGQAVDYSHADGAPVVAQLEELRAQGASFLLVPRPAFWWLDTYPEVRQYLNACCTQVWSDDQCLIYHLCSGS